jgi:hypothetical protein
VAWPSRAIFLKGLRLGLKAHPEWRRTSSKDVIALDTFMRIVEELALRAEPRTGRDVRALKKAIATLVGCSEATVQRAGRIGSRVVRCLRLIVRGRQLTQDERIGPDGVWRRIPIRGKRLKQHGVPPVRAFHVPAKLRPFMAMAAINTLPVDNHTPADLRVHDPAHQSPRGRVDEKTHLADHSPSQATNRKAGSLRSPNGPDSVRTARTRKERPPGARELAADLVKELPWLRSEAVRRIEGALKRFAESRPVWTAEDLHNAIQTIRERRGLSTALTDDQIRTRPAVVLAAFLRELDPYQDHPRLAVVEPAELRCGRTECDHGWITLDDHAGRPLVRKCGQCRPGAWPEPTPTVDDLLDGAPVDDHEPPF